MTPEYAKRLLTLWERALPARPVERTALILQALGGESVASSVTALTLGERHRALLRVRCALFGSEFAAAIVCPTCGERLTARFCADDVAGGRVESAVDITWMCDDATLTLRAPTLGDLLHAADAVDVELAWQCIVRRCITSAARGHQRLDIGDLPIATLEAVGAQLERIDPDSRHTLQVNCDACGESAEHSLDLGAFLWHEIEAQALRLLREVAQLARGYGWCESDILAMTPLRRAAYLEMLPA
jgi:hypothetical protein